jgi:hypothetical protein
MAEKEIFRLRGEAQEDVKFWDETLKELHGKTTAEESFLFEEPGDVDIANQFEEWWRYARAKALDEGKRLPTPAEVTSQAVVDLMRAAGFPVPKKTRGRHRKS